MSKYPEIIHAHINAHKCPTCGRSKDELTNRERVLINEMMYLLKLCEHGDFSNGVTDPSGSMDEGEYFASGQMDRAKSLINAILMGPLAFVEWLRMHPISGDEVDFMRSMQIDSDAES